MKMRDIKWKFTTFSPILKFWIRTFLKNYLKNTQVFRKFWIFKTSVRIFSKLVSWFRGDAANFCSRELNRTANFRNNPSSSALFINNNLFSTAGVVKLCTVTGTFEFMNCQTHLFIYMHRCQLRFLLYFIFRSDMHYFEAEIFFPFFLCSSYMFSFVK